MLRIVYGRGPPGVPSRLYHAETISNRFAPFRTRICRRLISRRLVRPYYYRTAVVVILRRSTIVLSAAAINVLYVRRRVAKNFGTFR